MAASIYRCGASIHRWPHLFIDAAASIYRWPHLFIDAAIYKIDFLKFNLLSNGLIEKFWDALWLGIGPFLCLTGVAYPCEAFLKTAPPILARLLTKTTPIDAYHEIWRYASCRISEMHITHMGGGPRLKPFNTPIGMNRRDLPISKLNCG